MASYSNTGAVPVKVTYKVDGKTYNVQVGDGNGFDDGKRTSYPFDEVVVVPGATVELGAAAILNTIELSAPAEVRVVVGDATGAAGEIVNNGPHTMRVDYQVAGVAYAPINDSYDGSQAGPWTEAFVPVGKAFIGAADITVLKTVDLSGEDVVVPVVVFGS